MSLRTKLMPRGISSGRPPSSIHAPWYAGDGTCESCHSPVVRHPRGWLAYLLSLPVYYLRSAQKVLYSVIAMEEGIKDYGDHLEDHPSTLLYNTLSQRPELASYVQSLSLGTWDHPDHSVLRDDAFYLLTNVNIAILTCCPTVQRVLLIGTFSAGEVFLLRALRACTQLRVLAFGSLFRRHFVHFSVQMLEALAGCWPHLQVVALMKAPPASPGASPPHFGTLSGLRSLELNSVNMSDAQFVALTSQLGTTLRNLRIVHSTGDVTFSWYWYSRAALSTGLAHLLELEHLFLDISRISGHVEKGTTATLALLSPLSKLRTVYITPDTFPFTGLGHLSSTSIQHFHYRLRTGDLYPPIDTAAVENGIRAMLSAPAAMRPATLSIMQQDDTGRWADQQGPIVRVDDSTAQRWTDLCKASGVIFTYTSVSNFRR